MACPAPHAAGRRHFGADNVADVLRIAADRLGDAREPRRPCRDGRLIEDLRIVGAAHRAVEMDLGEAGTHIVGDHRLGLGHGVLRCPAAPGLRPEVIAAKDGGRRVAARIAHEPHEVRGQHAGIAAILVDLVAGRLDQRELAAFAREAQRGLDRDGVGRAHRGDPAAAAVAIGADDVDQLLRCTRHAQRARLAT